MDKDAYIKQLETENAELKQRITMLENRIERLERRLGTNSRNSSKPPSSDPPGTFSTEPKHRRKKHGARNGHEPHLREPLPQEFVKECFHLKPEMCTCGSTNLEKTNEEPLRHQIVDIPKILPFVIEYVQHIFRCKDCGALVYKPLPDAVLWRKSSFGTQSERGARYVERILTVCATCQLQGRSVIEYLRNVCHCHLNGLPVPSLIKSAEDLAKSA